MKGSRLALLLLLAAAAAALLLHALHFRSVADDAYISFTYAKHLVAGDGLVFNPGERVMGYSSLTWVLLLAGLMALGVAGPVAGQILGAAASLATLALCAVHWRRRGSSAATIGLGLAFVVSSGTFACWVLGGLEGPLFGALLLGVVVLLAGPGDGLPPRTLVGAGVLAGLMCLTRPEAFVYLAPLGLGVWVRSGHAPLRSLVAFAAPALLLVAAHQAFVLAYYGDLVSNTAHAKYHPLSGAIVMRGWSWTRRFLQAYCYVPALIVLAWLALLAGRRGRAREWLGFLLLGAFLAFYLRVGGDALVYYRMWQPFVPLLALLAVEVIDSLAPRALLVRAAATALFALMIGVQLLNSFVGDDLAYLRRDDFHLARLAEAGRLLARLPPDVVIAANVVGRVGYYADHRVIDMLGLADRHIARAPDKWLAIPGHGSHDGRYVLGRRPDLVVPGYPRTTLRPVTTRGLLARVSYRSDADLLGQPEFLSSYRAANLRLPGGGYLGVWLRRDRDWSGLDFVQPSVD